MGTTCYSCPQPDLNDYEAYLPKKWASEIVPPSELCEERVSTLRIIRSPPAPESQFKDITFPHSIESIGQSDINLPSQWIQIHELYPNGQLYNPPQASQPHPVSETELALKIVEEGQLAASIFFNRNVNGLSGYLVKIFNSGVRKEVLLDGYVPINPRSREPLFAKCCPSGPWRVLVEKALAKQLGTYSALSKKSAAQVLQMLSPAPVSTHLLIPGEKQDEIWEQTISALQARHVLLARGERSVRVTAAHQVLGRKLLQLQGKRELTWQQFCGQFEELSIMKQLKHYSYNFQQVRCVNKRASFISINSLGSGKVWITIHQKKDGQFLRQFGESLVQAILAQEKGGRFSYCGSRTGESQSLTLETALGEGNYVLYLKSQNKRDQADLFTVSVYSERQCTIRPIVKQEGFINQVMANLAQNDTSGRQYLSKDLKDWVSTKLLLKECGLCAVVVRTETPGRTILLRANESSFSKAGFSLKKPHRGKGFLQLMSRKDDPVVLVAKVLPDSLQREYLFPPEDIQISDLF